MLPPLMTVTVLAPWGTAALPVRRAATPAAVVSREGWENRGLAERVEMPDWSAIGRPSSSGRLRLRVQRVWGNLSNEMDDLRQRVLPPPRGIEPKPGQNRRVEAAIGVEHRFLIAP